MSVRSKETNTFSPLLLPLVSLYIKLLPIGGNDVAPLSPVVVFVFVERIKLCFFHCYSYHYNFFSSFVIDNHHYLAI